ncbi:hypothetical protein Stsp02_25080 [Streptomyces sp. NBRC 14336]|nr:hypothetical protein Stsp02_25080 [Streptomyces sp. NBRC 14336]
MRYADGGGLTAAGRAKREAVRFEAAEMFERGGAAAGGGPQVTGVAEVGVRLARLLA